MMTTKSWRLVLAAPFLLLLGCVHYEAMPLDVPQIVAEEDALRAEFETVAERADLNQLADCMRERGPAIRRAWAAYQQAEARAGTANPWPNPTIHAGPTLASGRDILGLPVAAMGGLGLTIPLSDRLSSLDLMDDLKAKRAELEFQLSLKDSILELRRLFESLGVATKNYQLSKRLNQDIQDYVDLTRRRIEAGRSSARDLSLYLLEKGRADLELMESESKVKRARARLAGLVGLKPDRIAEVVESELPPLEGKQPEREELVGILLRHHPQLARKRAAYELAEAQLRLEVAKQYPDLEIGFSGSDEAGEEKQVFGLTLGIEVPLFDRNQKGIAEATAGREAAREDFKAEATVALTELDDHILAIKQAQAQMDFVKNGLLPESSRHLANIRESVAVGVLDPLNLLDAERIVRRLQIDALEAEQDLRTAWADLEQSLGCRIRAFPGETNTTEWDSESKEIRP